GPLVAGPARGGATGDTGGLGAEGIHVLGGVRAAAATGTGGAEVSAGTAKAALTGTAGEVTGVTGTPTVGATAHARSAGRAGRRDARQQGRIGLFDRDLQPRTRSRGGGSGRGGRRGRCGRGCRRGTRILAGRRRRGLGLPGFGLLGSLRGG